MRRLSSESPFITDYVSILRELWAIWGLGCSPWIRTTPGTGFCCAITHPYNKPVIFPRQSYNCNIKSDHVSLQRSSLSMEKELKMALRRPSENAFKG